MRKDRDIRMNRYTARCVTSLKGFRIDILDRKGIFSYSIFALSESRWSPPLTNTHNSGGDTCALPDPWRSDSIRQTDRQTDPEVVTLFINSVPIRPS
ncbi:hypothetical protein EVAR_73778_1 [Eumeta japonica]|uniref:Uncharacterized protein n=1 Tax=Eumeta variegata TaxID=151549 RepID=A0A4C2A0V0_EUMVA|nr:hypothetical protein EVAR_73778_1 [Eumeta japonica]